MRLQAFNGKLLAVELGGGPGSVLNARTDPDKADIWENITEITNDDGTVSLRSHGGFFCSAQLNGTIEFDRTTNGPWERWTKVSVAGGVGFRSAHQKFLCADKALPVTGPGWSGFRVVADRAVMGPFETFKQSGHRPVPVPRGPLPPLDPDAIDPETNAPLPIHKTLNGTPPSLDDPTYHRANLWGVTLPGLPVIDGGASGAARDRLLTYLVDRLPPNWQDAALKAYGERGYRHFWISIPDSRDRTHLSLAQYADLTRRVKDAGLIPCHFLRSKDYDGANPNPTVVYPWVDELLKIDERSWLSHAWEASLFYDPAKLRSTIDSDATRYNKARWCVHLQQGYADFGPDGEGHGPAFWQANLAVGVKTLLYQYVYKWTGGMMQARGNDVSVRLVKGGVWGLPETVNWVAFEVIAAAQFNNEKDGDGRLATEDIGDVKGYQALCTPGPLPPSGFGNGARMPDGSVI